MSLQWSKADQAHMMQAIAQARLAAEKDEVPVGAVIVYNDDIIGRAHNQVELLKDPTAHAEMIAITQATNALAQKWLEGCTLYVTIEPCCMCAGALVLSRIHRLVYGAPDPKSGACGSVMNIAYHNDLNHRIEVNHGLFKEDCGSLLTEFFKEKRRI